MDVDGNLLIGDRLNHRVVRYSWNGREEKFIETIGQQGRGEFEFYWPRGVCVDSENRLVVADSENHRVVMLSGVL